jgi:hypothetical protein
MSDDEMVSLREHYEMRFRLTEELFSARLNASAVALEVAKEDMERRLQSMNEFRAQLTSQAATFITKDGYTSEHKILENKIDDMKSWILEQKGTHSRAMLISSIMLGISVLALILSFLKDFAK